MNSSNMDLRFIELNNIVQDDIDLNNIDKNKFLFEKENGEKVECETVLSFFDKQSQKNYILFTDNTYDEEKNFKIYAYYNTLEDETLIPIEDEQEFKMVNDILEQFKGDE